MTRLFIQLHSQVIDFSTLSFLFLNENLPQYYNIYHKKLRKASAKLNSKYVQVPSHNVDIMPPCFDSRYRATN